MAARWLSASVVVALAGIGSMGGCGDGGGRQPTEQGALGQVQERLGGVDSPPFTGVVSTVAGSSVPGSQDASDALQGRLDEPAGIAARPGGTFTYIADWTNNNIRRLNADGSLSTFIAGRPNLLVNPRAELAVASPWIQERGVWSKSCCGSPYDGTGRFYGSSSADAKVYQDISIANNPNVAAGTQVYDFSALYRAPSDQARFVFEFLDSAGNPLTTNRFDSGFLNSTTWKVLHTCALAPTNAKGIRFWMQGHVVGSGSSPNAYFDSLQVRALLPTNIATSNATDQDLVAPTAVGIQSDGDLWIGADGLYVASGDGASFQRVGSSGSYVAPQRVSGIAVAPDDYVYAVDSTDTRIHVITPGGLGSVGTGYYVNVGGAANAEPMAVAVAAAGTKHRLWVAYRGVPRVVSYDCAKSSTLGATVTCSLNYSAGSTSTSMWDDRDGTMGGEQFGYINGLALGQAGDVLIAQESKGAIRRHYWANAPTRSPLLGYTRTVAGWVDQGFTNGILDVAQFLSPNAVTVAPNGCDLLVADRLNHQVRKITGGAGNLCGGSGTCPSFPIDDQIECTSDTCEVLGVRHTQLATGASCSDGNTCNGTETCNAAGVCLPGSTPVLDDAKPCTADACDPTTGITHTLVAAGTLCATGDKCAPLSQCDGVSQTCPAGAALPLDDNNPCTIDACTQQTGPTHTPAPSGTACGGSGTCDTGGVCSPTDLAQGSLDGTVATSPSSLFGGFLASGGGAQAGATACVWDSATPACALIPSHMALVRGVVTDGTGAGLAGATISVVNHAEYGSTQSLANGEYFLVVNGGDPLTLRATQTGKLSADRVVNPPWGGTGVANDIALLAPDSTVTSVAFGATGGALAAGSVIAETGFANRQAKVYFPQDASVTADGSSISNAKFRVTEFTVGTNGRERMPADIADNTMYTYAAEFSLESSTGQIFSDVQFSTPVVAYLTNFLKMPVGDTVPVGYYNRAAAHWEPMSNGRVIQIADTSGNVSGLQTGDPVVTADERAKLASYAVGTQLWRVPLSHFSPVDLNFGIGAPSCEGSVCAGPVVGPVTGGADGPKDGSCEKCGSIIDVERQVLRESIPVAGTPFSLNYSSENTPGFAWARTLGMNFESHPKHSKLEGYTFQVTVAGKSVTGRAVEVFRDSSGTWPKKYEATWDGTDHDGRQVQGTVTATLSVGAIYKAQRLGVTRFGSARGPAMSPPSTEWDARNQWVTIWTSQYRKLSVWDASALGFGGWTLNAQHAYDPVGGILYLGDGTRRQVDALGAGIVSLVSGRTAPPAAYSNTYVDGLSAAAASWQQIESLAVGRDGEIYAAVPVHRTVRKISVVGGSYTTVNDYAGKTVNATSPTAAEMQAPDPAPAGLGGVAAVGPSLWRPYNIALHDDGRLVISDRGTLRIYIVDRDGMLRTIAGRGTGAVSSNCGVFSDGTLATQVDLCAPGSVATGPDGSTYVFDHWPVGGYVVRIDPSGRAFMMAGNKALQPTGPTYYHNLAPGTSATNIALQQNSIAVDRTNTIWIATEYDMLAISATGEVRTYPTTRTSIISDGAGALTGDLAVFPNGDILRKSGDFNANFLGLQRCTVTGQCSTIYGGNSYSSSDTIPGVLAVGADHQYVHALATGPDGSSYFAQSDTASDNWRIMRILPPPTSAGIGAACAYKVPSQDGGEYYCFDARGQHQATFNALTNTRIRTFHYASTGLLDWIVEGSDSNSTTRRFTIDRSVPGQVGIKPPSSQGGGAVITLDTNKRFASSIAAATGTVQVSHDQYSGLLNQMVDADSRTHTFGYDNFGRLASDSDAPATGVARTQYIARSEAADGTKKVAVSTLLGKSDSFAWKILDDGNELRTLGLMNGLSNTILKDLGGTTTFSVAAAAGDTWKTADTVSADPRFGFQSPFLGRRVITLPDGAGGRLSQTIADVRSLSADQNVLTDTITATGATTRSYTRTYNNTARTVTLTSPLGRTLVYNLDAEGRTTGVQRAGVNAVSLAINSSTGRLDSVGQGTRTTGFTYATSGSTKGFLTQVSDTHNTSDTFLSTTIAPDSRGLPLTVTHSNSGANVTAQFGWTANGQLKQVVTATNKTHIQSFLGDLLNTYTPPTLGGTDESTTYAYDQDRYLLSIDSPGWDDLAITTDPVKGRPTRLQVGAKTIDYSYYGAAGEASCPAAAGCSPGLLKTITDNRTGSIATSFKWAGPLPLSLAENGATTSWRYDNDFNRTAETLVAGTHSSQVALGYDADGLLTCASLGSCDAGQVERLAVGRDTAIGRVTSLQLGAGPTETWDYNLYGELKVQDSTPIRIDYEDLVASPNVPRDASGRIKRRKERVGVGAAVKKFDYTYDDLGRLWKVSIDGVDASEYRYDNNGNRIYAKNSAGTVDGANANIVYDAQDRLTQYGTTTFGYTLKGDLSYRSGPEGTTTYDYDALGALRSVGLPGGQVVEYVVDGLGRRIGKKRNGVLVKQWYYGAGMAPLAEADGSGNVLMRFVYASKANVPDVVKTYTSTGAADKLYRLVSDQLGTPRALLDASGTIVKSIEFDEFGIKLSETNSSLELPFGFAGGLYDPDTKLTRFGARDYDASIGRWVSKDPILFAGRQANLYTYVNNDPVNFVDPSGKVVNFIIGAAVGGATNAFWQFVQGGGSFDCFRWGEFGVAVGFGALTGGLSATAGLAGNVAIGAIGSASQYAVTQAVYEKPVTANGLWAATLLGALGGGAGKALGSGTQSGILFNEGSRFLDSAAAQAANSTAASATAAFFQDSAASFAGGFVANAPGSD